MQEEKIGSPYKNVVLETASKVYVKTGSRYYEIDFRDKPIQKTIKSSDVEEIANKIADEKIGQIEKPDLSNYVTINDLDNTTSNYVTKRDFETVKNTQTMLSNVLRSEFSEAIKPITVQTMQLTVGSDQLQFDWIKSFDDGAVVNGPFVVDIETNKLTFKPGHVKHYALCAPEKVQPEIPIQNYFRWYILNPNEADEDYEITYNPTNYYAYLQVPFSKTLNGTDLNNLISETKTETVHKGNFYIENDTILNDGVTGFYAKTGVGRLVLSPNEMENYQEIDENTGIYNLLYATIAWSGDVPEVTTLNGFTEITPGQIRAYIFSTPDGKSFLDLKNSELKLGDQLHFKDGTLQLQGGVLAGLIGARDANNNIVAGINGADKVVINGTETGLKDAAHGKLMMFAGAEDNDLNSSKFKVNEDGFLTANSAYIRGGIQQPMVPIEDNTIIFDDEENKEYEEKVDVNHERYDNWTVPVFSGISSTPSEIYVPVGENQIGRRMTFVGDMWRRTESTGGSPFVIKGKNCNFYEDGKVYTQVKISAKECIELFGFGESSHYELDDSANLVWKDAVFYGWVVTNRFNINTKTNVGKPLKAMAYGHISTSTFAETNKEYKISTKSVQTADGGSLTASRTGGGVIKINFPESWNGGHINFKDEYIVIASTVGDGRSVAVLREKANTYFIIDAYDENETGVDFEFVMFSLLDWTANI